MKQLGEPEGRRDHGASANVYHVTWKATWAIAIVHETTCVLSLVTDHGNWSHRWNPRGLPRGVSFHRFLASLSDDYVLNKIMPTEQRQRVDGETTKKTLRGYIIDNRRDGRVSKERAREAWDSLLDWDPEDPGAHIPEEVDRVVSDAWECYSMTDTTEALAFRQMWPAIRAMIADNVNAEKETAACPA